MMMDTSNLFNSSYSSSNPFNIGGNTSSTTNLENSLMDTYAKIEALKAKQAQLTQNQQPQRATVFTDISSEFKDLSEDEISFIVNSQEYQEINNKYQTEFSQFLVSKFANEYLQTGNTRTLEEMLHVIRNKKENYKKKFADDINQIRDQNKNLLDMNNELAKTNQALQEQLKQIQERLKEN